VVSVTVESPVAQWLQRAGRSSRVMVSNPIWNWGSFPIFQLILFLTLEAVSQNSHTPSIDRNALGGGSRIADVFLNLSLLFH